MSEIQLLLIAGTHGNEINAPWLFEQWDKYPDLINTNDLKVARTIGNPEALQACKRYLNCDLNRSFRSSLLNNETIDKYEVIRARELLKSFGPNGTNDCQIAIDLHSTTSSMGSCLVIYGRRHIDLAIASLLQSRLGLPIYLHEGDNAQQGFLVESWPCGFVIEIGPVPQGVLHARIINQTRLVLETCLEELGKLNLGMPSFPDRVVIHRHIRSIDFPRSADGRIEAYVHPLRQGDDWTPIGNGTPLFMKSDGEVMRFEENESLVPVFINEAAYVEKNIAMSLTKREVWTVTNDWRNATMDLFSI